MIDEIKKLRRKGLSFRKIAEELDSTVGKVQYQWKKHKESEKVAIATEETASHSNKMKICTRFWKKRILVPTEHLTAWIIDKNKLFVYWRLLDVKKDLVSSYFDKPFTSYQQVLRVYDVTNILFDGSNAHQVQEVELSEKQGISLLNELQPNRCYMTELGVELSDHKFFPLLRSNVVHIPRTDVKQAGNFKKDSDPFSKKKNSVPNWVEHVSTYSYYEKMLKRDDV
ncbi:DUF4912 domain-containing protein [Bacillus sp. V3B]|uniref:DUF4912 domain-containing protein n=1 Tax=Bacillus sp. V3B TaxID=2804915 RepID=UPI00210AB856|nr:DUF4912 domain-containing protein [Bacillus sp. V3B]MCQ6273694.1 DUF4912 domain-containing protein [Bacillus sp. V3B]